MNQFHYVRGKSASEALAAVSANPNAAFLAGGTTLVDLMKLGVERPAELIDINPLPLAQIEARPDGGVRIGALARNSDVAHHELIRTQFPVLSEALLSGASAQLRNMATVGGNIMQRTRCYYFRDLSFPCNKRQPGSGCPAMEGFNRMHAILGTSEQCIATNPSDMNVAMIALDAVVRVQSPGGERTIPFGDFHLAPGDTPQHETALKPGELITAVDIPGSAMARHSHYLKLRDRASYEFALASVALALEMADSKIANARVAFGGVATKPWRARNVEQVLTGQSPSEALFARAAEAAVEGAKPRGANAYKVELLKRAVSKSLRTSLL
ncbi:MAG: xanthine dehydrogenase family protein subunit M [Bryobacteraceae bacterium]